MRTILTAIALLSIAAPAAAQVPGGTAATADLWARQEMDRQRMIGLQNDLVTLESRMRAQQAAQALDRALPPPAPSLRATPAAPLSASELPQISDERLARSNAAVRAASQGRDGRERDR